MLMKSLNMIAKRLFFVCCIQIMWYTLFSQTANDVAIIRDVSVINPVLPSPEMAALGRFGEMDIDKTSGVVSHAIPIHNINFGGMTLPIQLQYSSDGFRPSDIGSYLGMHWSLTGLGGISRQIKGYRDDAVGGYLVNDIDQDYISQASLKSGSYEGQNYLDLNKGIDISQDAYTINFPGISGQFFINSLKEFEYSIKTDNKIFYSITPNISSGDKIKFWVLDTKGNKYEFEEEEETMIQSQNGYHRGAVTTEGVTSWKIKRIVTNTGRIISFNYIEYQFLSLLNSQDVFMTKRQLSSPPLPPPDNMMYCGCSDTETWQYGTNQYSYKTKLISSIVSDNETVEFIYEDDLNAANYKKKLTEIRVKDKSGIVRKKFNLNFGYFAGNPRLKLNNVKQIDLETPANSIVQSFTYYEDYAIPSPTTRNIDFYNYFNGSSNWHLIYSTHPDFTAGAADRIVRQQYARQTLLKEIRYPTGGTTSFTYEPNGDLVNNNLGPGLRVKDITNRDREGNVASSKEYVYKVYFSPNPLMINNTPIETYVEYTNVEIQCRRMVLTSDNHFSTISNIIPHYSKPYYKEVDVLEKGNTFNLKSSYKFTMMPTMVGDEVIRPESDLVYKYDGNDYVLISKKEYEYNFKGIEDYAYFVRQFAMAPVLLTTYKQFTNGPSGWCMDVFNGILQGSPRYQSVIQLKKVVETSYEGANSISTEREMIYDTHVNFPSKIRTKNSKNEQVETEIKYPADFSNTAMVNRNMVEFVLEQREYNTTLSKELSKVRNIYNNWHAGAFIKLKEVESSILGNILMENSFMINNYDTYGNVLEIKNRDGIITSFIWGYDYQYPVAKIVGKGYSDIITESGIDLSIVNNLATTDHAMRTELNKLRTLTNVMTTSFTYKPLVGITSETSVNNRITYYEYDGFNRLHLVKDDENNILKRICYNYFGEVEDCGIEVNTSPQWLPTGATRCEPCAANNNYTTANRQREEKDNNPNSPSYNLSRWVLDEGVGSLCIISADWQYTVTAIRCKKNGSNQNTGEQEREQRDMNPCSSTYNQLRWVVTGTNTSACPIVTQPCTFSNCNGQGKKCVNGVCETGIKVYTGSTQSGGQYECTFHYEWSDGTWSRDYLEFSNFPCPI